MSIGAIIANQSQLSLPSRHCLHSLAPVSTNRPLYEYVNQFDYYFSISRYCSDQAYYKLCTVREKALCLMEHNTVLNFQLMKFHFEG